MQTPIQRDANCSLSCSGLADVPGSPSPHKAASVQAMRSPTTVLDTEDTEASQVVRSVRSVRSVSSEASLLCHSPGWPHEPEAKTTKTSSRRPKTGHAGVSVVSFSLHLFLHFVSSFSGKKC